MVKINPELPTVGADDNTWGDENNAVHAASIAQTNEHDDRIVMLEGASSTLSGRVAATELGAVSTAQQVAGLAVKVQTAAPAAATSDALAAAGTISGDPTLIPFSDGSPWRLGISSGAQFALDSDARNGAIADVDTPGMAWINSFQYSHPIAQGEDSSPLATMQDTLHTSPTFIPSGGSWLERIPSTAVIAGGTDRHMHVVTPDRTAIIEHFGVSKQSDTAYKTTRRHLVNLMGSGIGPQNGTRAYGGSAIGGLIRAWEIDPGHPAYTGEIRHPLALALPTSKMLYTGTDLGDGYGDSFGSNGYGLKRGYVWPATEQDYNSDTSYKGPIPMGSFFAIKPDVDLTTLGLNTAAGMMIAKALQDYGAYVTDTSATVSFYVEDVRTTNPIPGVTYATVANWVSSLKGTDFSAHDLKILYKALRVITNNGPFTPNGGRLTDARRGSADQVTAYPPVRPFPPINPSAQPVYIDTSTKPPTIKGWNGTAWVSLASSSGGTDPIPTGSYLTDDAGNRFILNDSGDLLSL